MAQIPFNSSHINHGLELEKVVRNRKPQANRFFILAVVITTLYSKTNNDETSNYGDF